MDNKKRCVAPFMLVVFVIFGSMPLYGYDSHALVSERNRAAQARVFNIKSYGAVGDGVAMDTRAVQETIDACHAAGGGMVWVPAGDFQIGTVRLKSDVTLSLDYGASLLGSTDLADYPTEGLDNPREGGPHCLIYAKDAAHIAIEGLGVIDGRGTHLNFPRNRSGGRNRGIRPRLLRMDNCDNLTFSGVTYKRPAFWGLHLIDCKNIHFNAVTVRFRNNNYNNDGLDIDGCENVLIENCDLEAGDDAICLKSSKNPCRNIVVRACRVASNTAALKLGTSSRGGFIDVRVTNCYFYDCPMGAIKLQSVDGGRLENIDISRVVMENVGNPIFMRLGDRGKTYARGEGGKAPVGTLKNVRISDVVAEVTLEDRAKAARAVYKNLKVDTTPGVTEREKSNSGPIMITGIPGHCIENVVLENIKISYPGGGTQKDAERVVPEDIDRYPEQYFFGVLPSWGAYVRHAKNIEFKNVEMTLRNPDARKKIVLDDVAGFTDLETLAPLAEGKSPQTHDALWGGFDPQAEPLDVEVLKAWEDDGVVLKVLRYRIGIFKGQKAMMAAVCGYPKGAQNLPGLVQIHGGGQYAHSNAVFTNAKRGYATISISWAGRIDAPGYRVTPDIVKLLWEGKTDDPQYKLTTDWGALDAYHAPTRNPKSRFAHVAPQPWTLDEVDSPRNNPWFLCTLGARIALTFLEPPPQVDRDKLGVYGHSMGGKLTVLTTGSDDRVKAAAPSCGGISNREGDTALFRATIGDDAYLKHIACPIMFLSPANDFHGRINDLQTVLTEIKTSKWRVTCAAHHNHQDTDNYEVMNDDPGGLMINGAGLEKAGIRNTMKASG